MSLGKGQFLEGIEYVKGLKEDKSACRGKSSEVVWSFYGKMWMLDECDIVFKFTHFIVQGISPWLK